MQDMRPVAVEPFGSEAAARVQSKERFIAAHRKAWREDLMARLGGRGNDLLPFDAVMDILQTYEQIAHREPQMIPLDKIVGSVGRYKDFTRSFLPRSGALMERWARVERHMEQLEGVPPIDVFKVGDVYFVADGNHRVSVARANGFDQIEAYVTEYPVDPGLEPGDSLDQAIIKAGRARFLAETQLERDVPNLDIYLTRPGGYRRMLDHIAVHRHQMQESRPGATVSFEDAALDWYNTNYLPIIAVIRDRRLLERFPGRTAADLYIWVWNVLLEMHQALGEPVSADEGAALLELRAPTPFRRAVHELMNRISGASEGLDAGLDEIPQWATPSLEWGDSSR
jgi:hypothetical protein